LQRAINLRRCVCVSFQLAVLLVGIALIGQELNPAVPQAPAPNPTPASPVPASPDPAQATTPEPDPAPAGANAASSQGQESASPQQPQKDGDGMFVMRKQVNEVALHATVIGDNDQIVTSLNRSAFTVFEDGRPQPITSFRREDVPVSLGILIDNSGSMREKRPKVEQAALNLIRASNADDEVMIVNFSEEGILDQDFTSDLAKLKQAMERHEARGSTALYDAVDGAATHLRGSATHEKKIIFLVTDGADNSSRDSLEKVLHSLQQEGAPTVYAIALPGHEEQPRARQALQLLAERTGGVAFFAESLDEVDEISRTVAHDIRNQYSIGYKPSRPRSEGGYRTIRVEAHASGYRNLNVRTKRGYDATQNRDTTSH